MKYAETTDDAIFHMREPGAYINWILSGKIRHMTKFIQNLFFYFCFLRVQNFLKFENISSRTERMPFRNSTFGVAFLNEKSEQMGPKFAKMINKMHQHHRSPHLNCNYHRPRAVRWSNSQINFKSIQLIKISANYCLSLTVRAFHGAAILVTFQHKAKTRWMEGRRETIVKYGIKSEN